MATQYEKDRSDNRFRIDIEAIKLLHLPNLQTKYGLLILFVVEKGFKNIASQAPSKIEAIVWLEDLTRARTDYQINKHFFSDPNKSRIAFCMPFLLKSSASHPSDSNKPIIEQSTNTLKCIFPYRRSENSYPCKHANETPAFTSNSKI